MFANWKFQNKNTLCLITHWMSIFIMELLYIYTVYMDLTRVNLVTNIFLACFFNLAFFTIANRGMTANMTKWIQMLNNFTWPNDCNTTIGDTIIMIQSKLNIRSVFKLYPSCSLVFFEQKMLNQIRRFSWYTIMASYSSLNCRNTAPTKSINNKYLITCNGSVISPGVPLFKTL
jgi:hypothetical protein